MPYSPVLQNKNQNNGLKSAIPKLEWRIFCQGGVLLPFTLLWYAGYCYISVEGLTMKVSHRIGDTHAGQVVTTEGKLSNARH